MYMFNRLNGYMGHSNNGNGKDDDDSDDVYDDGDSYDYEEDLFPEDKARAIDLASSMRGQWLISMALYNLLFELKKSLNDDNNTAESITKKADHEDVEFLVYNLFPLYKNVQEREEEDE